MKAGVGIGAALLLVVGAVLAARFGGPRGARADEAVSAPGTGAVAPAERPPALEHEPDELAPAELAVSDAAPVASDREEVAPALARGGLELLVSRPDGEGPSPGAEVRYRYGNDELRSRAERPSRVDELLAESPVLRADGRGRVALPPAPAGAGWLLASARTERAWGRLHVELTDAPPNEPWTVTLALDVTLEVQVVDPRGLPVPGTSVVLVNGDWNATSSSVLSAPAEGPEAIARFPHAQETVRGRVGSGWRVAVDALLEDGGEQALLPGALPEDVVRLVLPMTGSVEVRVFDEAGAPAETEGEVSLAIVREREPRTLSPFSHTRRRRYHADVEQGVARFSRVELGKELELSATRKGSGVESTTYGMGPMHAGQHAVFELTLGADHPVLVGRAVDEASAVLAGQELSARVYRSSRYLSGAETTAVVTDPDGRFRLDISGDWAEGTKRTLTLLEGDADQPRRSALVDLSRELPNGTTDLGDLTLVPPALFVAGRVVDHERDGWPGAQLVLEHRRSADDGWWEEVDGFDQRADGSGRFEARGSYPGQAFRMRARASSGVALPVEFQPGETDLVLTLQPGGAIAGSVLLDERIDRDLIRVRVGGLEGGSELDYLEWHERSVELDGDDRFRFPRLLPGEFKVSVVAEREGTALHEVLGVLVAAEQETRDPRLQEIDLRGALQQLELDIVDPLGSARLQGVLNYGPAGSGAYAHRLHFYRSPVKLLVTELPLDLSIEVGGYRRTKLESVAEDREVHVERGPEVRIVLTGAAQVPDPPYFIKVALVPLEGERTIDWSTPCFDEQRAITVHAPGPGRMRVQWLVERREASGAIATFAELEEVQVVEVLDQDTGQVIEVPLDEAGLETLLSELD